MPADRVIYLFGIAGHAELSPAMTAVQQAGWEVVIPSVPGFDGVPGFVPRDEYLDWLTTFWDCLDATGALLSHSPGPLRWLICSRPTTRCPPP